MKTYKMYIGGKFPRTESGHFYKLEVGGKMIANLCQASRKDLRNAVEVAAGAQSAWAGRTAFNRSQIIYRIAEVLEGRRTQFVNELKMLGIKASAAEKEVQAAIDMLVYYAGWCDKIQAVFSSVNPVASSHFNFSQYEAMGVVVGFPSKDFYLTGLLMNIIPTIIAGNSIVVCAQAQGGAVAVSLAEVFATSDVPGGVINILTGDFSGLVDHALKHKNVNAIVDGAQALSAEQDALANDSMKRVIVDKTSLKQLEKSLSPYPIIDLMEVKTTWHPIEPLNTGGAAY